MQSTISSRVPYMTEKLDADAIYFGMSPSNSFSLVTCRPSHRILATPRACVGWLQRRLYTNYAQLLLGPVYRRDHDLRQLAAAAPCGRVFRAMAVEL